MSWDNIHIQFVNCRIAPSFIYLYTKTLPLQRFTDEEKKKKNFAQ